MTRFLIAWLSFGCLSACYNQDNFTADLSEATCEWWDRCDLLEVLAYDDVTDCFNETESEAIAGQSDDGLCPTFDRGAAKACVSEVQNRNCEDGFDAPSICEEACPTND